MIFKAKQRIRQFKKKSKKLGEKRLPQPRPRRHKIFYITYILSLYLVLFYTDLMVMQSYLLVQSPFDTFLSCTCNDRNNENDISKKNDSIIKQNIDSIHILYINVMSGIHTCLSLSLPLKHWLYLDRPFDGDGDLPILALSLKHYFLLIDMQI